MVISDYITPVMYSDPSGKFAISLTILGLIIGAVVGATAGGIVAYNVAKDHGTEGWDLVGWTALGIVGGGLIGGALGAGVGALATKITGIYGFSVTKYHILPIKQVTILGHKGYVAAATSVGAGYYQIPYKLYSKLEQSGKHLHYNLQYLKDAHSLGSQFEVIPNRVVDSGSMLYYELQYLVEKGIAWIFGF